MDAVLGLSMTPTSVGLVLVEGQDADGATMDRNSFAVSNGPINTAEQATAAVKRTEALAANRGLRLHSIGVTWSEDADAEASMLMQSLSESGFDNVVAIRMPEATEALARGIADVLGYATTAVCVIEPGAAISLIVNTSDGAVQTAFNHAVDSDGALIAWLSTIFTRADWEPEALVLVGSVGDFGPLIAQLEDALSVPVFAPEAATLALARGAALASAQSADAPLDSFDDFEHDAYERDDYETADDAPRSSRLRPWDVAPARQSALLRVGPAAMLATGLVTFVVSVSIAVSLQLAPNRDAPNAPVPAARTETPGAVRPAPPVMPPPVAIPPAPVVEAALPDAPPPEAPPPVYEEAPAPIADVPAEAPSVPEAPAADPGPVDPALAPPAADTPVQNVQPPSAFTPSPVYQGPPPVEKKPGIWTRIKEKLTPGPG